MQDRTLSVPVGHLAAATAWLTGISLIVVGWRVDGQAALGVFAFAMVAEAAAVCLTVRCLLMKHMRLVEAAYRMGLDAADRRMTPVR